MQQYQRIESGAVNLTFTTLVRLAAGFGVEPYELLAPEPRKPAKAKPNAAT